MEIIDSMIKSKHDHGLYNYLIKKGLAIELDADVFDIIIYYLSFNLDIFRRKWSIYILSHLSITYRKIGCSFNCLSNHIIL